MAYTLQPSRNDFNGGKNILASEHVQFIEVGATLDATAFPVGTIEVGTLIARNSSSGKFEPYPGDATDETTGAATFAAGYEDPAVLNIDVNNDGENDTIVGEVIVRGSVYADKLPTAPTDAFKAANDNIRYVSAR